MSFLYQIGISYGYELASGIGHVGATLAAVHYECRGGRGCLKGSTARGASNSIFRHHFHRTLTDAQGRRAKTYADACRGLPYVYGGVPNPSTGRGGDCSGFQSGIMCAADNIPIRRLFATGTWKSRYDDLKFRPGLTPDISEFIVDLSKLLADIDAGRVTDDIGAIKRALNKKLGTNLHSDLPWGPDTKDAYARWRQKLGYKPIGIPGTYTLQRLGFRVVP
jgi:hypothetical protein